MCMCNDIFIHKLIHFIRINFIRIIPQNNAKQLIVKYFWIKITIDCTEHGFLFSFESYSYWTRARDLKRICCLSQAVQVQRKWKITGFSHGRFVYQVSAGRKVVESQQCFKHSSLYDNNIAICKYSFGLQRKLIEKCSTWTKKSLWMCAFNQFHLISGVCSCFPSIAKVPFTTYQHEQIIERNMNMTAHLGSTQVMWLINSAKWFHPTLKCCWVSKQTWLSTPAIGISVDACVTDLLCSYFVAVSNL